VRTFLGLPLSYDLLNALGALEIMDPKTDSGMIFDGEDMNAFDTVQSLLPEELIWII
jgi:hypothetical protein